MFQPLEQDDREIRGLPLIYQVTSMISHATWWLIPLSKYNPNYKWINPTYPIYNWGYNPDEPPSSMTNLLSLCFNH